MAGASKFLIVIGVAAVVGFLSANHLVEGSSEIFSRKKGEWRWWPNAGSKTTDPYTRLHFISQNRLPLSRFETLELETRNDSAGRQLSEDCSYLLSGQVPAARWWSLASYNIEPPETGESREITTIGSHDVLLEGDGVMNISISNEAQAGNWMKPAGGPEFVLLLRIYEPANNIGGKTTLSGELPTITRLACR